MQRVRGIGRGLLSTSEEFAKRKREEVELDPHRPRQLILAPEARWVALFVPVIDPEFYPEYRLQIVEKASAEEIWSADQLVLEEAVLSVSLPASLVTSDHHELDSIAEAGLCSVRFIR